MSDMIETKTQDELTADLINNMPSGYQTSTGFPIGDFFTAIGIVLKPFWNSIVSIYQMLTDLSNWDLSLLKIFCYERRNIIYKEASASSGYLTVTGDFSLNVGDQFQTSGGIIFEVTEATASTNESASVPVQCTITGMSGNVAVNTITLMPITLTGVTSVTNETAFTNGYDEEGKSSYLQRYYDDLAMPIISGNKANYKKLAKECGGVGDARVVSLWNGDNTVKVIIINSNYINADDTLISEVQQYIDPYTLTDGVKVGWGEGNGQAPCGAYCTVVSATALDINISANVIYNSQYLKADVDSAISANIASYLKTVAFNQNYLSYAKIGESILNTVGVIDYNTLLVNSGTSNISIPDEDVAVLKTTTFTEVS